MANSEFILDTLCSFNIANLNMAIEIVDLC